MAAEKHRLQLRFDYQVAEKWGVDATTFNTVINEKRQWHKPETLNLFDVGLRNSGRTKIWDGWAKRLWDLCHPPSAEFARELTEHMAKGGFWPDGPPEEFVRDGLAVKTTMRRGDIIEVGIDVLNTTASKPRVMGRLIPRISATTAGDPSEIVDPYPVGYAEEFIIYADNDLKDPHAFALLVEGNSMEPELRDGDIAICSPAQEPQPNEIVVFKVGDGDGKATCKVYKPSGDMVHFVPINRDHEILTYKREEVVWVYVVCAVHRKLQRRKGSTKHGM